MTASSIRRLWNRDLAAVLNFRHILTLLREKATRPDRFMPQKQGKRKGKPRIKHSSSSVIAVGYQ
ncbi:hypothetical protein K7432_012671 [Basidiobolus ranarum]|uniref:Ribosomal protein S19 n=1 Tax=Basidiobolus ranarum TaxID=34480 RepID=A0ABR2VSH6_9FUNG